MTLILESSSTVREELQAKRNDETDAPQRSWSRGNWQLWGLVVVVLVVVAGLGLRSGLMEVGRGKFSGKKQGD